MRCAVASSQLLVDHSSLPRRSPRASPTASSSRRRSAQNTLSRFSPDSARRRLNIRSSLLGARCPLGAAARRRRSSFVHLRFASPSFRSQIAFPSRDPNSAFATRYSQFAVAVQLVAALFNFQFSFVGRAAPSASSSFSFSSSSLRRSPGTPLVPRCSRSKGIEVRVRPPFRWSECLRHRCDILAASAVIALCFAE